MATSSSDGSSSQQERSEDVKGVKIDSKLIQTAALSSSTIQDELKGLRVSVYDQQEFEAGVLKQIDDEVQRRTYEQDKKFLLKNHSTIKGEINAVRIELNNISKTIALLLALPMTSVASRLRELRTAQELKTKQLNALKAKEQSILKKLANRDEPSAELTGTSNDVPFGIPRVSAGGIETERERLIRMGHLTPFGTKVEEFTNGPSSELPIEQDEVSTVKGLSVSEATLNDAESASVDSGNSRSSLHASLLLRRKEPSIRLCSDSFNGLFANDSVEALSGRKNAHRIARIPKKKEAGSTVDRKGDASTSEPNTDTVEPNDANSSMDQDDWIPSLAQFMEPDSSLSSESEYFTDDEMGEVIAKKGKMRLRELSSDGDLSSEEDEGTRPRKRKKRGGRKRKKKLTSRYNDDGDEDGYRLRMQ